MKAVQISGTIKCIAPEKSKLPLQRVFGLTPCQPHPSGNSTLPLYFSSIKGMEIFTDTHNLTIIIYLLQIISLRSIDHLQPGKTADILRCQCWFPHKMTSEKWGQKFHTDDSSPPRSGKSFWLVGNLLHPIRSTNWIWVVTLSSVWNFCTHFSDFTSQENHWWCPKMENFLSSFDKL